MSAKVLHGRRKGQERGGQKMPIEPQNATLQLPSGNDLRQVTVLSKTDWERIQRELNRRQIEEDRIRRITEEREEQRNRSKEMVKNWGNTIAGQRQRKLEARKIRERREEEERVKVDLEEAQYQAAQRKEAIEKAKTQQYYQTDRVKAFHGALLLTEVLKEREAQLELKQLKERASEGKDQEWLELQRREYEEGIQKDHAKAAARIAAASETAAFQTAQIREHMIQTEKEVADDCVEGSELKTLAMQHQVEKERLENIRRDERKQMMLDNLQQQQDVIKMREINQMQEEEEDEECRIFAAAKRKMMKLRAEKEKHIHREKQQHLEKIREKLGAQMKEKLDDEDERIKRAEEEIEQKRALDDVEKSKKIHKMIQESAEHRNKQMKEHEEMKKHERREELEMVHLRKAADEIFQRNEEEKQLRKRTNAAELKDFHQKQLNDRRIIESMIRQDQLALDKANMDLLDIEERQFQEYANKVIDHCEKGGRNVYPLRKAAKQGAGGGAGPIFAGKGGIRPSYMACDKTGVQMPHYQRDSTNETKDLINAHGNTKKRMGFVW
ncbi:coiled-coil domain-containing protein 173-like [Haliotis rubra]|uniref:coiled-coil domain-containing protein 173-like n=1 Tax=Haliotis rubra TaxID=36100 RepID=UPI001EE636C1|nr:coiled-coil domain-containing protein 173-like [Haliotis rubra]